MIRPTVVQRPFHTQNTKYRQKHTPKDSNPGPYRQAFTFVHHGINTRVNFLFIFRQETPNALPINLHAITVGNLMQPRQHADHPAQPLASKPPGEQIDGAIVQQETRARGQNAQEEVWSVETSQSFTK